MADQNLVNNAINYLQEQQNDIIKSEIRPTDVKAPEIVTEVKIYQDNVTNKWIKDEKEVESQAKDDSQLAVIEQKLIDTPIALQQSCAIVDNKILAINAQINGLKSQIATLSSEATAGNCWPGIACSTTIFLPTTCTAFTVDYRTFSTIKEDRELVSIYPKLSGPGVDYTIGNAFEGDTTVELTSSNSGYGYLNTKSDDSGTTVTTQARYDISGTLSDHNARTISAGPPIRYYTGAGAAPYASDTSMTPARCVEIKTQIDSLIAQIAALRSQRDSQNRTSLNTIKDKKTGDEVRAWGIIKNRNTVQQLKTDNNTAIAALSDLL